MSWLDRIILYNIDKLSEEIVWRILYLLGGWSCWAEGALPEGRPFNLLKQWNSGLCWSYQSTTSFSRPLSLPSILLSLFRKPSRHFSSKSWWLLQATNVDFRIDLGEAIHFSSFSFSFLFPSFLFSLKHEMTEAAITQRGLCSRIWTVLRCWRELICVDFWDPRKRFWVATTLYWWLSSCTWIGFQVGGAQLKCDGIENFISMRRVIMETERYLTPTAYWKPLMKNLRKKLCTSAPPGKGAKHQSFVKKITILLGGFKRQTAGRTSWHPWFSWLTRTLED